jgi:hypothetical protein
LFVKSADAAEGPLPFQIAEPVAICWSDWPVTVIGSWSWARATIHFRSLHMISFDVSRRQKAKIRFDLVTSRTEQARGRASCRSDDELTLQYTIYLSYKNATRPVRLFKEFPACMIPTLCRDLPT